MPILLLLYLLLSINTAFAAVSPNINSTWQPNNLLTNNIKTSLIKIYGNTQAESIYPKIINIINELHQKRPQALRLDDIKRDPTWYKDEIIYIFYPENFGVPNKQKKNTFNELINLIPYLKSLGITTVYILPFYDSPLKDAGFDVIDLTQVRKNLGEIKDLEKLIAKFHANGIKVIADLILNHISNQSSWYQEALHGNKEKLNYFIVKRSMPQYNKYKNLQRGIVIDYIESSLESQQLISSRRLMFPEITPTHYHMESISGEKYYFYHTFYPFQLDLNWQNPQVLFEMLNKIRFWCNKGIDIFRLDAVPFLIKPEGTTGENLAQTHALINLISSFIQAFSPRTILLAEAGQSTHDLLPYFGKEQVINYQDLESSLTIKRTNEAQTAYNFPLAAAIWSSLILEDNKYFWHEFNSIKELSPYITWINFLKVHDETTLEVITDAKLRQKLYDLLKVKGIGFRQGLGASGRMANFLDNDPRRIKQAFAILLSLPDIPAIYYGDEIGIQNNWDYAHQESAARLKLNQKNTSTITNLSSTFDPRDINRGPILKSDLLKSTRKLKSNDSSQIYSSVSHDIALRKNYKALRRGTLEPIAVNNSKVLSYVRRDELSTIWTINNLSNSPIKMEAIFSKDLSKNILKTNSLIDLRSQNKVYLTYDKNHIKVWLKPYQTLWLKIK